VNTNCPLFPPPFLKKEEEIWKLYIKEFGKDEFEKLKK